MQTTFLRSFDTLHACSSIPPHGAPRLLGLCGKNLSPGFEAESLTPGRVRQGTTQKLQRTLVINDIAQSVGLAYLINKYQP